MEIKEILNSGLLESYVLGVATPQEGEQIEHYKSIYPEINEEIEKIKQSLEIYALDFEQEPPAYLRDKILNNLNELASEDKQVEPGNVSITLKNKSFTRVFAMAASYTLLLASIGTNIYFYSKWKNSQELLSDLHSKNEVMASNYKTSQKEYQNLIMDVNILQNPETKTVMLQGLKVSPKSWVKLYWNKNKKMVLLASHDLPTAPEGMEYQLWAIMDGKPLDMGMLDAKNGMQMLKQIPDANAFAITLEKKGGRPQPEGEMYVMGKVSA